MRKLLIPLVIISCIALFLTGCNKEIVIEYTKLTTLEEVPVKIMENIREIDLQRGAWAFQNGDWYGTELNYFMVCGGENYVNGYDVEVKKIVGKERSSQAFRIIDIYLTPFITEIESDMKTPYSEGLEYPIVIFRIDTKYGDKDSISRGISLGDPGSDDYKIDLELMPNYPPE